MPPKTSQEKNKEKPKHKQFTGVELPEDMQSAGIGTSHWNVAAPRHLGALDPQRELDSRIQTRLTSHADVPEWKKNKEDATEKYARELFEESKRLQANRIREQEISLDRRWRSIREHYEDETEKLLAGIKAKADKTVQEVGSMLSKLSGHLIQPCKADKKGNKDKEDKPGEPLDPKEKKREEKRKKRQLKRDRVKMPAPKPSLFGAAPRWRDEEAEPEDEQGASLPCGVCECGGEEFLCAHCDFIRCRSCELGMWQVPHLGALVCDRCYVWYRKPGESSSSDDEDDEQGAGGEAVGGKSGQKRPVKRHGKGRWTPPEKPSFWQALPVSFLLPKKLRGKTEEEEKKKEEAKRQSMEAEQEEEEHGPGLCQTCWEDSKHAREEVEYVCAHCDTIYCPYCQLEVSPHALTPSQPVSTPWSETSRTLLDRHPAKHRAVTAPFPAPIKDVREGAAIKAKEGAAKGRVNK